MGIPALPSRRTLVLNQWLKQRMEEVYPQEPGYQGGTNPSVRLERPLPQRLPDALEGKQWAFVSLEAGDFAQMPDWEIGFGEAFPLELAAIIPRNSHSWYFDFLTQSFTHSRLDVWFRVGLFEV